MSDKFDRFIDTLKSAIDDGRCGDRAVIDAVKAVSDEGEQPIELFVGARCVCRNGKLTTIGDGDDAIDGYDFVDGRGVSYMADGSFYKSREMDVDDIVKILNQEDRPVVKQVDPPVPISLFVGARCRTRRGKVVTIISDRAYITGYDFADNSGVSYMSDGRYYESREVDCDDIAEILNPEDRPKPAPPVKYRSVNKSDIDKEVEVLFDDGWTACTLKAIMKTPAPDGSSISVWCDDAIDGAGSYTCLNEEVRIIARDDDKVMKTVWLNAYDDYACCHSKKGEAKDNACDATCRARIKVEYYDGQYDE